MEKKDAKTIMIAAAVILLAAAGYITYESRGGL